MINKFYTNNLLPPQNIEHCISLGVLCLKLSPTEKKFDEKSFILCMKILEPFDTNIMTKPSLIPQAEVEARFFKIN